MPEPRLIVTDEQRAEALAALGLQAPEVPLLAIAPGAEYGPAKRWPARHFATLAAAKRAQGWQVWVFGSPGDRDAAAEFPPSRIRPGAPAWIRRWRCSASPMRWSAMIPA